MAWAEGNSFTTELPGIFAGGYATRPGKPRQVAGWVTAWASEDVFDDD
jgi:hypothetical protein